MKSKFMENVFRYIVSDFKNNLSIDYIKKIEDIYKNEDLVNYPNQNIYMIESLLDPWLSNKPEKEIKDYLEGFLLEEFGDLRNPNEQQTWLHVKEDYKKIFRDGFGVPRLNFLLI